MQACHIFGCNIIGGADGRAGKKVGRGKTFGLSQVFLLSIAGRKGAAAGGLGRCPARAPGAQKNERS
jgi:hypothetical protein